MNGTGLFLWKDGRKYKGQYKEDKKSNFGCYYGTDEKKYEGIWENGIQKGLGRFTKKDNSDSNDDNKNNVEFNKKEEE